MNKKNIFTILIVVVVIILIFISIKTFFSTINIQVASPKNMITQVIPTDWKTYINDKYGFNIKYPSTYSIFTAINQEKEEVVPVDSKSKIIIITNNPRLFFGSEPSMLSVEILDEYVTDLKKWVDSKELIDSENEYRVKNVGYFNFAGEKAYRIQAECGADSPGNSILVNHNSKTYLIYYDSEDCLPLSEKIISTFKFIDNTN